MALWLSGLCKSRRNSGYSVALLLSSFPCGLHVGVCHVPLLFHLLASFRRRKSTFFKPGLATGEIQVWFAARKHNMIKKLKAEGTLSGSSHMRL